jgi:hypothetical protein
VAAKETAAPRGAAKSGSNFRARPRYAFRAGGAPSRRRRLSHRFRALRRVLRRTQF